jgi:cysteine-rich repeat protein
MKRFPSLLLVLLAACSDPVAERAGASDTGTDLASDAQSDGTFADTSVDATPDTSADTEDSDTGSDAQPDTTVSDTPFDVEPDTALDTISDTEADTAADTEADTAADTEADTAADTEADAALDTISDTDTEADADTEADTEADTAADTTADTTPPAVCGDGLQQPGEDCDNGAANSDSTPDSCRTDCSAATCGDLVVDTGESCDTGGIAASECPYGLTSCTVCASDCTLSAGATSYCGDGAITGTERCDDGNAVTESCAYGPSFCTVCNASCRLASVRGRTCGDEVVDPEEQCDDGNLLTEPCAYGQTSCEVCAPGCLLVAGETAYCGDGVVDASETCDDGNAIVDGCPYGGASCTVCGTNCRSTAGRVRVCGDGTLDAEELCDDGNTVTEICAYGELSCTVCDSLCALVAGEPQTCGNGTVEAGEECDDGLLNDDLTADACRRNCTLPNCGDGTRDSIEACDDGNLSDRDQCTSTCELGLGRPCAPNGANADCLSGWCSNGFCAPEGMAFIAAGSFTMGSPVSEFGRDAAEEDLHSVTLTRAFYMDLTETTQGAWKALAGPSGMPSWFDGSSACNDLTPDNCPVESIGSTTAAIYANARSAAEGLDACYTLTGCSQTLGGGTWQNGTYNCTGMVLGSLDCNGYRLPTEAEWEYAYRAGTTSSLYNGEATTSTGVDPLAELIAVYLGNAVRARTGPVGQYSPNAWGLYDMAGNVQEWVEDRYTARLRDATDPINTTGSGRVIRGGFYGSGGTGLRASYRIWFGINLRDSATGFRLVRTVTPANLR